jgi:hypothetical protein
MIIGLAGAVTVRTTTIRRLATSILGNPLPASEATGSKQLN